MAAILIFKHLRPTFPFSTQRAFLQAADLSFTHQCTWMMGGKVWARWSNSSHCLLTARRSRVLIRNQEGPFCVETACSHCVCVFLGFPLPQKTCTIGFPCSPKSVIPTTTAATWMTTFYKTECYEADVYIFYWSEHLWVLFMCRSCCCKYGTSFTVVFFDCVKLVNLFILLTMMFMGLVTYCHLWFRFSHFCLVQAHSSVGFCNFYRKDFLLCCKTQVKSVA